MGATIKVKTLSGLVLLLFFCWTENLMIEWASENLLIETWYVFSINHSGIRAS